MQQDLPEQQTVLVSLALLIVVAVPSFGTLSGH